RYAAPRSLDHRRSRHMLENHHRSSAGTAYSRAVLALLALGALLLLSPLALAQRFSTGQEVMDAMADQPAPATTIATLTMTVTAASGHSLTREMQIWTTTGSDDAGANQLIKFTGPADVRGSGFMSVGGSDGA